jgi:hypothetical protein
VARRTLGANHVTFVPEMGGPFRSHGPKPLGSHGDRRHAGVDGSQNSGFLYLNETAPRWERRSPRSSPVDLSNSRHPHHILCNSDVSRRGGAGVKDAARRGAG